MNRGYSLGLGEDLEVVVLFEKQYDTGTQKACVLESAAQGAHASRACTSRSHAQPPARAEITPRLGAAPTCHSTARNEADAVAAGRQTGFDAWR